MPLTTTSICWTSSTKLTQSCSTPTKSTRRILRVWSSTWGPTSVRADDKMARRRVAKSKGVAVPDLSVFWQDQIRTLGRKVFFVDTGGILKTLEDDPNTIEFFTSIVGVRLLTST